MIKKLIFIVLLLFPLWLGAQPYKTGVAAGGDTEFTGNITFTLAVGFADGIVTAPGIAFALDLNTGIYRIGTDNMGFTAGGLQFLNFNNTTQDITTFNSGSVDIDFLINGDTGIGLFVQGSDNFVGIGTTSPGARFEVALDSNTPPTIDAETAALFTNASVAGDNVLFSLISGNTGSAVINFGDTDDENIGRITYSNNSNDMAFLTLTAEKMRILDTGEVGIGTASPEELLHILNPTGQAKMIVRTDMNSSAASINTDRQNSSGFAGFSALTNNTEAWFLGLRNSPVNEGFHIFDVIGSATRMFFASNSPNVGIGTTSPGKELDVSGDISIDNTKSYFIKDTGGTAKAILTVDSGDEMTLGSTDLDDLHFDVGAAPDAMILKQGTGNLGLGTTAPGTLLQLTNANAYITLQNSTAENGQDGAETRIIFEDHANAALAQIQAHHEGTSDDTKGGIAISVHDGSTLNEAMRIIETGNVGIGTTSPDEALDVANQVTQFDSLKIHREASNVADDGQILLATGVAGEGWAMIGDSQERVNFSFTAAAVVTLISNTSNVVNTDTDTNFCIFDNGSGVAIKNRLGSSLTVAINVSYYVP